MSVDEPTSGHKGLLQYREAIEAVCEANGVSVELVESLLQLEERYRNIQSWGARPRLRSEIKDILEMHRPTT
jgi:hypothetical protein